MNSSTSIQSAAFQATDCAGELLCIDDVIPGASSAEVIKCTRETHPDRGIVVCSGYVEEELARRGIQTGNLAYVRNPCQSVELLDCIHSQLVPL